MVKLCYSAGLYTRNTSLINLATTLANTFHFPEKAVTYPLLLQPALAEPFQDKTNLSSTAPVWEN